ncbi:hypothetical protein [Bradyrhizobium japonicum]|uniref:hypothetical protein n=1 Tax=Bradyrhizobium japonicum TaxID=375 RepID=UPI0020A19B22|nr:hypothetical protein [Bradyrhizobium japonicum]MCP1783893.1 hypothetical protein [Bradyrhizobium japonicum]MCP1963819.1 hypothetical protein [Bradyrhizobium japonicum]
MRGVLAVTIVVLTTTLAQGAEWLLPIRKDCELKSMQPRHCEYSNFATLPWPGGAQPEVAKVAKQVYTVQEVDGIKTGLEGKIVDAETRATNKATTALDAHKTDVAGKLKGLITPELLAQIRKELVPEVTKEVMAKLRKEGLLDRP